MKDLEEGVAVAVCTEKSTVKRRVLNVLLIAQCFTVWTTSNCFSSNRLLCRF